MRKDPKVTAAKAKKRSPVEDVVDPRLPKDTIVIHTTSGPAYSVLLTAESAESLRTAILAAAAVCSPALQELIAGFHDFDVLLECICVGAAEAPTTRQRIADESAAFDDLDRLRKLLRELSRMGKP